MVQTYDIGANARVTGLSYAVNITAFDPSYLSEARLAFTDSGVTGGVAARPVGGVVVRPGSGADAPGTQSFAGSADLESLGLAFNTGSDGLLRLEYHEGSDDEEVAVDAIWNSGTVTVTYTPAIAAAPEPAAWGMMIVGFGAAGGALRRTRRLRAMRVAIG